MCKLDKVQLSIINDRPINTNIDGNHFSDLKALALKHGYKADTPIDFKWDSGLRGEIFTKPGKRLEISCGCFMGSFTQIWLRNS